MKKELSGRHFDSDDNNTVAAVDRFLEVKDTKNQFAPVCMYIKYVLFKSCSFYHRPWLIYSLYDVFFSIKMLVTVGKCGIMFHSGPTGL